MSTHQDYMDERMLHAFLDGELDGTKEELLFEKLSSDSALRTEMQQHLAMRKAIQHDNEAFTPPAAATSAIFAALGFSLPPIRDAAAANSGAAAGGAASAGAGAGAQASRRLFMSAGSAVLAILVAVLMFLQFPYENPDEPVFTERVVSTPSSAMQIEETPALSDIPLQAEAASKPAARTSATPGTPAATVPVAETRTAPMPSTAAQDVRSAQLPESRPLASLETHGGGEIAPGRVRAGDVQFFDLIPLPDGVTLYARNVALRSDPSPAVVSQSDPWFHNMNIGLLYALSEHHAIGIEGGQESFPQTFTGIEAGNDVRYEQNPMAYWATAVYQFNGDALLPHVHPFAQAQVGGALGQAQGGGTYWLGPLARATLGIKFRPFERIAIVAGVEGTTLLYRFQDNWFNTNKIGLTYGVAYEF